MFRLPSLIVALPLLFAAGPTAAQGASTPASASLDVPYVSQTPALCGGAAVAMVYRCWGDAHADAQQFAPLVDARAAGIAEDVLIDAVRERGWRAARIDGSLEILREQIARGRPAIILLEDRPQKYHYLVVTDADADGIVVHDPSWGPSRRIDAADLIRAWRPAQFWTLVITPPGATVSGATVSGATVPGAFVSRAAAPATQCDLWTDEAIAQAKGEGFETADAAFSSVLARCPQSAAPIRELAGVRFAQKRWRDAEDLATRAVALDPVDSYGWDVLASTRFIQNDLEGALRAWNRIGKPRVDTIDIAGLTRSRYDLMAETLGLKSGELLTPEAFARARRRLGELPDRSTASIAFRPSDDGFATVTVGLVERSSRPRGTAQWSLTAVQSAVNREVAVDVPGFTGQGELWSASWRWWSGRPRVEIAFATPRTGALPGVWRVEGSWESQRYADGGIIETRGHAGVTMSDWTSGQMRYSIGAGFDEWNRDRRTASATASLERRFASDRLALTTEASLFMPVTTGGAFRSASIRADARSTTAASRWVLATSAGATTVSSQAPFALWPGAGDGHARPALLRAHPLLEDGTVGGEAFGRELIHASGELQRWLERASPVRLGIAGFVDAARATRRFAGDDGQLHVDLGVGLRLKVPGSNGSLRVDLARGLRDGAVAFSAGWVVVR